jgi:hypothetical protein
MRPPTPDLSRPTHDYASVEDQFKPSAAKLQSALETDGQTFAGEMTITPTLEDENDPLDHQSSVSSAMRIDNSSPASSLLPPATATSPADATGRKRGWFERILARHGVITDEKQCRYHLQVFMDEVHPMYPVVHPPEVWEIFNEMWQHQAISSSAESTQSEQLRVSVALVCFCLALGRCSMSARMSDPSGVESSGWSLYSVGMSLLGDLLETSNTAIKSLLMLQVLIVRVSHDTDPCFLHDLLRCLDNLHVPTRRESESSQSTRLECVGCANNRLASPEHHRDYASLLQPVVLTCLVVFISAGSTTSS